MTEPAHHSRIGELVGGKYRIVRFLATGGMGVVYEAQHEVVKRRFAVKLLRADLAERRDILGRFQREAEAAGALESENVTAAVDFGIARDGTPYIVMEYLVGESLARLLAREERLSVARAAELVTQACRGMHAAHAAGIVHRDLKPQNLFVCRREDGTDLLKVLDFGVAKLQALDELTAATRTGTVMGTVSYMSPEQARGDKVVDQRADVYALGAILYQLLSGRMPHPGDSNNAILHHISTQPAVPLDGVQPGLPPTLVDIVARALSPQPSERPASAAFLGQALMPFARRQVWPGAREEDEARANGEVAATPPAGARTPDAAAPTSPVRTTGETGGAAAPRSRRMRAALAFGVATLLLGGITIVVAVRATKRSPGPGDRALASQRAPGIPLPPPPSRPSTATATATEIPRAAAAEDTHAPLPNPSGAPPGIASPRPPTGRPTPHRSAHPLAGSPTVGPAAARPAAVPSTLPSSGDSAAGSAARQPAKARIAPVTFDEQNPYN